jgi:SPOR domain
MRWRCSRAVSSRLGHLILAALWLAACASAPAADDIAGRYRHVGPVAATLEVRSEGGLYRVRLEGGGSSEAGAASAADCVIEARGELQGTVLRAPFGAVETDTFSYGAAQAADEARMVEIRFAPGAAEVVAADTFGYCGLGAKLAGRYRVVD